MGTSRTGSVFFDPRGDKRALRVTWHAEAEVVVLSLWRDNLCAGTFRLAADEVPALIGSLAAALAPADRPADALPPGDAARDAG